MIKPTKTGFWNSIYPPFKEQRCTDYTPSRFCYIQAICLVYRIGIAVELISVTMPKRNTGDSLFLERTNLTDIEIKSWIIDLFFGRNNLNFHLTSDVFEWWLEEALLNYSKAKSERVRRMILNKVLHTSETVEAGIDISMRTGHVDWDPFVVCTVCLLHDVGRFRQALLGSYSDIETNFDHAAVGAKMIDNRELKEMETMGINRTLISEAVRRHSAIKYEGGEIYAKLVRDADKLSLLRYMPYLMDNERFPRGEVDEMALNQFRTGGMVRHENMHTKADVLLAWLCWQNDFNFEATKMAFVDEGVKEWVENELLSEGVRV